MYTTRYAERKPGLDKSQGCWHCIILYYPLISIKSRVYKAFLDNGGWASHWTGFPHVFFTLFSGWIPIWGMEACHVYLLTPAFKFCERESPRWGTLQYSNGRRWPNVDGANLLSWGFISSPRKPSYSATFLHWIFLLYYSFLISLLYF